MVDKILKIDTVLGKATHLGMYDELLPIFLDGQEHVSKPFRFELVLLRGLDAHGDNKGEIDPRRLLGTSATFGLLADSDGGPHYVLRTGVFSEFHRLGPQPDAHDKRGYFAVLIPAFEFLGMETRYRIFENKTVADVLKTCLSEMNQRFPDFKFDVSSIENITFPKDFHVQYGESTFGFLSRLMARHGLFYFFGRRPGDPGGAQTPINDTMVIGRDRHKESGLPPDLPFASIDMEIFNPGDDPSETRSASSVITGFRRIYTPSRRNVSVLDFNILDPTDPVRGKDRITPGYDVVGGGEDQGPGSFLRNRDSLAAIALKTSALPASEPSPADDYAEALLERTEPVSLRVTGNTANPFFSAGTLFHVALDHTIESERPVTGAAPDGLNMKDFVLETVHLSAAENSYKGTTAEDVGDFFSNLFKPLVDLGKSIGRLGKRVIDGENLGKLLGDTWDDVKNGFKSNAGSPDPIISLAAQGISNYLQNEASDRVTDVLYPHHPPDWTQYTPFWGYFFGGILANATGVLPSLFNPMSAIGNALLGNDGKMSAGFVAIPFKPGAGFPLRSPAAGEKPRASGPHFATVVGFRGVLPDDQLHAGAPADIFADAFGRVRIRFPWDPGPPASDGGAPTDPWQSQLNTCWVRVAEGWAGDRFGTQFLPRVGQEVLVDFIDGDPERPVIVGRMYNARNANAMANLPFRMPGFENRKIDTDYLLAPSDPFANDTLRRSGIKTRTTPVPNGKTAGFHLLRLDDDFDEPQYLMRSQARMDVTALRSRYETTQGNRHVKVATGKDKNDQTFGGASFTTTAADCNLHVGAAFHGQTEKNCELTVKGDMLLDLEQNLSAVIKNQVSINASSIVLEAGRQITLKVGGSSIVITNGNIYIWGPPPTQIDTMPDGPEPSADVTVQNVADAETADPGDPDDWLQQHPPPHPSSGGGPPTHTAKAQHAPPVSPAQAAHEREQERRQVSFDPGGQSLEC